LSSGHPRVSCRVEGCPGYTTRFAPLEDGHYSLESGDHWELLCARHWRRVPKSLKRRRRALLRLWDRLALRYGTRSFWQLKPGSPERIRMVRLERTIKYTWNRCCEVAWGLGEVVDGELPPGLVEELRRDGLI
jgi:hypothetical protein